MSTMSLAHRPWWPWVRRIAVWSFFGLIAWLLVNQARAIDWQEVLDAMRALPASTLLLAGALAAGSFATYSTYDLLGRYLTRHRLRAASVMGVTFISYAFNLNLGSLVGGVAFRYRLYSRLGLGTGEAVRICLATAGLWWGAFTVFTVSRLRNRPVLEAPGRPRSFGVRGRYSF